MRTDADGRAVVVELQLRRFLALLNATELVVLEVVALRVSRARRLCGRGGVDGNALGWLGPPLRHARRAEQNNGCAGQEVERAMDARGQIVGGRRCLMSHHHVAL